MLSLFQQIENGELIVIENDGTVTTCCNQSTSLALAPSTTLRVARDAFWLRLALFADMVSVGSRRNSRSMLNY